jgi:hypothetical protein
VSDSGFYCLWPINGPVEEIAWNHDHFYTGGNLLPLNNKSVRNYHEYEIKSFGLYGNVGNIFCIVHSKIRDR